MVQIKNMTSILSKQVLINNIAANVYVCEKAGGVKRKSTLERKSTF